MKTTQWITGLLVAGVIALAGCGKSSEPAPGAANSPMVDLMKLTEAFQTATPELRGSVDKIRMGVRYSNYPEALVELDKLASDANVTEPQKKAVNDVIEQLKKALSAMATNAPAGTQ